MRHSPQSTRKISRVGLVMVTRVRPVQGSPDKSVLMREGHGQTRNPHQPDKLGTREASGDADLSWHCEYLSLSGKSGWLACGNANKPAFL